MVVLGIVGPPRSGKKKLAQALCTERGFRLLVLGVASKPSQLYDAHLSYANQCACEAARWAESLHSTFAAYNAFQEECTPKSYDSVKNPLDHLGRIQPAHNGGEDIKRNEVRDASQPNSQLTCARASAYSASQSDTFEGDVDALIDYVTARWRDNFVILGLTCLQHVQALRKRPFFALVAVELPLGARVALKDDSQTPESLLHELLSEDAMCFANSLNSGQTDGVRACMTTADVHVTSNGDFEALRRKISGSWLNEELVRPSWDTYFMRIAFLTATRSNCMKRRKPDRTGIPRGFVHLGTENVCIVATGYNGTPSQAENCRDGGCARCNNPLVFQGRLLEACECIHAEVNALLEAGRDRAQGSTLYVTSLPCLGCAKLAVQCVIKSVIYAEDYDKASGALDLFRKMGVTVHHFNDLHPGIPGETLAIRSI